MVGDEVWKSGAQAELERFAEKYRVPVASGTGGYFNFPSRNPFHLGRFSMRSAYASSGVDLELMVGARDLGIWRLPSGPEAPVDARIVRIGLNSGNMGRNYPTDLTMLADVKQSLADLDAAMEGRIPKQRMDAFGRERGDEIRDMTATTWGEFDARVRGNFGLSPRHPDELTQVMARAVEPGSIVVGEVHSGYNQHNNFHWGYRDSDPAWSGYTGNSLGWGVGAATGAKAATVASSVDLGVIALIDERKALRICSARFPELLTGVTLDVFTHHRVTSALGRERLSEAVFNALVWGRVRVPSRYLQWVVDLIGTTKAKECRSLPRSVRHPD